MSSPTEQLTFRNKHVAAPLDESGSRSPGWNFFPEVWLHYCKTEKHSRLCLHRLDGPAVEYITGENHFYLFDLPYKEQQFWNHPLVVEHKLTLVVKFDV